MEQPSRPRLAGDEYDPVTLRASWGGFSCAVFLLALSSRYIVGKLSPTLPELWMYPLFPYLVMLCVAAVGTLLALLGLRFDQSKAMARIGALLNGTVLGTLLLLVGVIVVIVVRRRTG